MNTYHGRNRNCHKYTTLSFGFFLIVFLIITISAFTAEAENPEFINIKLEQSTDQIVWKNVDGTFNSGFTMELNSSIAYYYLDFKNIVTNVPLKEGFYGFSIISNPDGFFSYWDEKGVNSSAVTGTWQEQAWEIINGNSPTFYIHVDSDKNIHLIDGLLYDWAGDDTALLRVNGDYPIGSYSYRGIITAEDNTTSNPIDISIDFASEINPLDRPKLALLEMQQSVNEINWMTVPGSLYSGFTVPMNTSESNYSFKLREIKSDRVLMAGYYGFYLTSYPSGYFSYWASYGVDGTSPAGTWEAHMWKIINGDAPRFYLYVDGYTESQEIFIIDGLQKDFYGNMNAKLSVNGDIPFGMYTFTGALTSFQGIDSDLINVFFTFVDYSNYQVYVDDNYDSSVPGWGVTHFDSITDGINAVIDGGIVNIKPGTYKELVQINKQVILRSTYGADVTFITDDGATYSDLLAVGGQTVQIASDYVLIENISIHRISSVLTTAAIGNNGASGISHVEIEDCDIYSTFDCTYFNNADNISFKGCILEATIDDTIMNFDHVNDFILIDTSLPDYNLIGIIINQSNDGLFYNCYINQNSYIGMLLNYSHDISIITSSFSYNYDHGIIIDHSRNIKITDTMFRENGYAITLMNDSTMYFSDNYFERNSHDINRAARIKNQQFYYSQLQEIIDVAEIGKTIQIYPGLYPENIIINKSITLKSILDMENTIIQGYSDEPTILIGDVDGVSDVTLDGLTIQGGNNSIKTETNKAVDGLMIEHCTIQNPDTGSAVFIDPHNYSDQPPIREGTDILSNPVILQYNTISGGVLYHYWTHEVYGVSVPTQLIIYENEIDHVFLNGSISVWIKGNTIHSLGMMYSSDVLIENNKFENPWQERYGIYLWSVNNTPPVKDVTIKNNIISDYSSYAVTEGISGQGIVIAGAMDVDVRNNQIMFNTDGIWITRDYYNLYGQRCVGDVFDVNIHDNDIEFCQTGIRIPQDVDSLKIYDNYFSLNGKGIWVHGSQYHLILNNSIIGNNIGIRFDLGSGHNTIYNNYFLDNIISADDRYSTTNNWNISLQLGPNIMGGPYIGGNYWSEYEGEDIDGDGIGDTLLPVNSSGYITHGGDYLPLSFTDNNPPEVEVIYPNGGESVNGTVEIQWVATDDVDQALTIDIEYSDDGGDTWSVISSNEENDGSYDWDTSVLDEGFNYMIRISTVDNSGNHNNDTSDSTFTIYFEFPSPSVTIVDPELGYIYFFNAKSMRFLPESCFIFGDITINVAVESDLAIEKVEFYVDNQLEVTVNNSVNGLYTWEWDERVLFLHFVKIIAYDEHGKTGEAEIELTLFNFNLI